MAKKKEIEETKARLTKERAVPPPDFDTALSTGSTLLNLACTGHPHAGYVRGSYYFMVGDTNSGKSWGALTALAEAANRPAYDGHRLVIDAVEAGVQANLARHFGRKMADRIEPACLLQGRPWKSERIEEFYLNLDRALTRGPCVYVLDSMDGLSSSDEEKKFQELKKTTRKGEGEEGAAARGSYGDGKAKKNSAFLRQMLPAIERTGSVLIIIDQTRDNVGSFSFDKKTRSGGRALSFYAQVECWSSVRAKIKRRVREQDRHVGNVCEMHVRRSRFTGHEARVQVPIYFTAGIDDVGGCVDYLVQERHWEAVGKAPPPGKINYQLAAPEFDFRGGREALVALIESGDREDELRRLVAQVWVEIEAESGVERKRRYE